MASSSKATYGERSASIVTNRPDHLSILLSDLFEAGLPEVFRGHAWMKGHARVEVQEKWFGN